MPVLVRASPGVPLKSLRQLAAINLWAIITVAMLLATGESVAAEEGILRLLPEDRGLIVEPCPGCRYFYVYFSSTDNRYRFEEEFGSKPAKPGDGVALIVITPELFYFPTTDISNECAAEFLSKGDLFKGMLRADRAGNGGTSGGCSRKITQYPIKSWKDLHKSFIESGLAARLGVSDIAVPGQSLSVGVEKSRGDFSSILASRELRELNEIDQEKTLIGGKKRDFIKSVQAYIDIGLKIYFDLPEVSSPSLPPPPTLTKEEFEKTEDFMRRVDLETEQREKQVYALQEKYRKEVEARNSILADRIKAREAFIQELTEKAVSASLGELKLQAPRYDADKEIMYVDMISTRSNYAKQLSVAVPLADGEAEAFKNSIPSIVVVPAFSIEAGNISLSGVNLAWDDKSYTAEFPMERYAPAVVQARLPQIEKQVAAYQNPNLVDIALAKNVSYSVVGVDDIQDAVLGLPARIESPDNWLFVVAVENYRNADRVVYSKNSGQLIVQAFQKRFGISARNTYALIDEDATAGAIKDQLAQMLRNIKPGAKIYFYYSGHGIPEPTTQEAYILPRDKVVDFIAQEGDMKLAGVYRKMTDSPAAEVFAFVDSCFSGRTDNVPNYKGVAPGLLRVRDVAIDPEKISIMTAGKNSQFSNAYEQKHHRMFSYYLLKSLVKPRPASVGIQDIFEEVAVGVRNTSSKLGDAYLQEPQLYGNAKAVLLEK